MQTKNLFIVLPNVSRRKIINCPTKKKFKQTYNDITICHQIKIDNDK